MTQDFPREKRNSIPPAPNRAARRALELVADVGRSIDPRDPLAAALAKLSAGIKTQAAQRVAAGQPEREVAGELFQETVTALRELSWIDKLTSAIVDNTIERREKLN